MEKLFLKIARVFLGLFITFLQFLFKASDGFIFSFLSGFAFLGAVISFFARDNYLAISGVIISFLFSKYGIKSILGVTIEFLFNVYDKLVLKIEKYNKK